MAHRQNTPSYLPMSKSHGPIPTICTDDTGSVIAIACLVSSHSPVWTFLNHSFRSVAPYVSNDLIWVCRSVMSGSLVNQNKHPGFIPLIWQVYVVGMFSVHMLSMISRKKKSKRKSNSHNMFKSDINFQITLFFKQSSHNYAYLLFFLVWNFDWKQREKQIKVQVA